MQWKSPHRNESQHLARPAYSLYLARTAGPRSGKITARAGVVLFLGMLTGVLLLSGWTAGCASKTNPSTGSGKAVDPPLLRIGYPKGIASALVENYASTWASRNRVRLEMLAYDPEAELAAPPSVDFWVISPAVLPRWAAANALHPLSAALGKTPSLGKANFLPVYQQLLTWKEVRYGLPLVGDALLCFYREDLFEKHAEAFLKETEKPLKPPETWEEYERIANFFHQMRAQAGEPALILPPLPASELGREREFYAIAASLARRGIPHEKGTAEDLAFHFDPQTGAPRIAEPGFVHALRLLQRLQAVRPVEPAPEPTTWFRDGKAVLCLASPVPWMRRFQSEGSSVQGRVGVCRVPGSREVYDYRTGERKLLDSANYIPYLGAEGLLGVVPTSAARPELAFALLGWLNESKISREIVTDPVAGGGPTRWEHTQSGVVNWGGHTLGRRTAEFADLLRLSTNNPGATNPVLRLRIPDERRFRQALARELRLALLENKDAEIALKAAAASWERLIEEHGAAQHLADYLLSIRLVP